MFMEENKIIDKKLILAIVGVLLVCAVGISFAYFVGGDVASGTGASVSGSTDELITVTYDAGSSTLNATNLTPSDSASKGFSVNVEPGTTETTAKYRIYIDITSNSFVYCDDTNYSSTNLCTKNAQELTYNLKDSSGTVIATGDLTAETGEVVLKEETKTVSSATDYNYTLEIVFNDTGASQNHNANKSITGNVKVVFVG